MGTTGPFGPETICMLDRQCYLRINDRAGIQGRKLDSRLRGNDEPRHFAASGSAGAVSAGTESAGAASAGVVEAVAGAASFSLIQASAFSS